MLAKKSAVLVSMMIFFVGVVRRLVAGLVVLSQALGLPSPVTLVTHLNKARTLALTI